MVLLSRVYTGSACTALDDDLADAMFGRNTKHPVDLNASIILTMDGSP